MKTGLNTQERFHEYKLWNLSYLVQILVRERGLEPPRVAPLPPQSSASTDSATRANPVIVLFLRR
jgi:hypothetical protein